MSVAFLTGIAALAKLAIRQVTPRESEDEMRIFSIFAALVMTATAALLPQPLLAADLVRGVVVTDPGICGNPKVLGRISARFDHQVRNVPHLPQVAIADFLNVRENRYLPQREDRPIERRYCQAVATLSNGHSRDVWYLIERPMGFAGIGSNVEFCVSGFDRWNVYGGRCRVLR
jgi:hypothetical protein